MKQLRFYLWKFKQWARANIWLRKFFNKGKVVSGARISFLINGVPVAYAGEVNYDISSDFQKVIDEDFWELMGPRTIDNEPKENNLIITDSKWHGDKLICEGYLQNPSEEFKMENLVGQKIAISYTKPEGDSNE